MLGKKKKKTKTKKKRCLAFGSHQKNNKVENPAKMNLLANSLCTEEPVHRKKKFI